MAVRTHPAASDLVHNWMKFAFHKECSFLLTEVQCNEQLFESWAQFNKIRYCGATKIKQMKGSKPLHFNIFSLAIQGYGLTVGKFSSHKERDI
jgi:hypothetical protein